MNNCDGTFEDTTQRAGIQKVESSLSLGLGDVDNDGLLDLFVGGMPGAGFDYGTRSKLYRNDGDGTFTDISFSSGIDNDLPTCGVGFSDYDEDGWIDIFVASCVFVDARFQVLRNNGDLTFSDVALNVGLSVLEEDSSTRIEQDWHLAVTFDNLDLDGDLDLFTLGQLGTVFENGGDGIYTKRTEGISLTNFAWGVSFTDFDNDG